MEPCLSCEETDYQPNLIQVSLAQLPSVQLTVLPLQSNLTLYAGVIKLGTKNDDGMTKSADTDQTVAAV